METKEQQKERLANDVEKFFKEFDENGDQVISVEELKNGLARLKLPNDDVAVNTLLKDFNVPSNGSITKKDAKSFLKKRLDQLRRVFDDIDIDKSGHIDKDEVKTSLLKLGMTNVTQESVDLLFDKMDTNKNGTIDFQEWKEFLYLMPELNTKVLWSYWEDRYALGSETDGVMIAFTAPPTEIAASKTLPDFLSSLLSGAIAGTFSRTATAPIERLKLMYQVNTTKPPSLMHGFAQIYKEGKDGGFKGLFRGNLANVLKIAPESAVKFSTYETLKKQFKNEEGELTVSRRFFAGALAGVAAHVSMYPLEVIKTRLAVAPTGVYNGIADVSIKMFKAEGPIAFYRGVTPAILSTIPHAGINLMLYETIKIEMSRISGGGDPPVNMLMAASTVSSTVSQIVAYPMHVVKTRMMAHGTPGLVHAGQYTGFLDVISKTAKNEGFRGFYKGIVPTFLKTIPANWVTYLTYEMCKKYLGLEKTKHH